MADPRPPQWKNLARALDSGVVLVVGPSDSGKTTLVKALLEMLVERGLRVAVVDCDMGQSTIGPPGSLGMAIFAGRGTLQDFPDAAAVRSYFFVGHFSPVGHLLQTVVGAHRLVRAAREAGAQLVLVDTTGLVFGGIGAHLKFQKAVLLEPRHIVLLQRRGELEHLRALFASLGATLHSLSPSPAAVRRDPEQRRAYRERQLRRWLGEARSCSLEFPPVVLWNVGHYVGVPVNEALLVQASRVLRRPVVYGEIGGRAFFLVVEGDPGIGYAGPPSAAALLKELLHVEQVIVREAGSFRGRLVALEGKDLELLGLAEIEAIDVRGRRFQLRTGFRDLARITAVKFGSDTYRIGSR